jgi:malonyl-CoA/methylmalonyl-CoA synthetase
MTDGGCGVPLIDRARTHGNRTALIDPGGTHSYADLLEVSGRLASRLLGDRGDLEGDRVCFLMPRDHGYVGAQWAIWRAGGVAVPLSDLHPRPELEHVIADCGASLVVTHPEFAPRLEPIARERELPLVLTRGDEPQTGSSPALPRLGPEREGMILYTSGSTGTPKGAVLTHGNIRSQITTLIEAWEWRGADHILHVLPLHHTHGIINALCCALWSGATCELLPRFDPERFWQRLSQGGVTLFMAVPTVYHRLIEAFEAAPPERQRTLREAALELRLMVSGSAPLPERVWLRWREITGQSLLERYGMTEIGMALSNPLHGERRPGFVGGPLPEVEVRLVGDAGEPVGAGEPGELWVRGPNVFPGYWGRPDATAASFRDGWFRTGDVAALEDGAFRILGRQSQDIIKTGGYKVSALEIEEVLRQHPAVADCAVLGAADPEWGERVCAAVVVTTGEGLEPEELREWARARLARYKIPSRMAPVTELPRNAMGKVQKGRLRGLFTEPT